MDSISKENRKLLNHMILKYNLMMIQLILIILFPKKKKSTSFGSYSYSNILLSLIV